MSASEGRHATGVELIQKYNWQPQPAAQRLVDELLEGFLSRCPWASTLSQRMKDETATRFKDWIDHVRAPDSPAIRARAKEVGYEESPVPGAPGNMVNPLGIFPPLVLDAKSKATCVGIKVDSVADFLAAHGLGSAIEGEPCSQFRRAMVCRCGDAELWAVERHGYLGHEVAPADPARAIKSVKHLEAMRRRNRWHAKDEDGFAECARIADAAVADLGQHWACDLWFESERRYWMQRNLAARVQKARQDRLGLGWANHDHHTYRCSRAHFPKLIGLWEKLGFRPREAFYAGAEAGWGAQVMEQPVTGITTFNDVDMSPEELMGDFAHQGFKEQRPQLGTVGLWCGLHGEALLQAGMHHLECQFDWHALVGQLEREHVKTMAPFTTFPYLRQAFTEGERWKVDPSRIDALEKAGFITREQGEEFRAKGAIGSHLENLERNDGFKGFNQHGVSDIIARTDPRKLTRQLSGA